MFKRRYFYPLLLVCICLAIFGLANTNEIPTLQANYNEKPNQAGSGIVYMPIMSYSISINTTLDGTDWNPGDGRCETAAGNKTCTLRAYIQETNAQPGADIIFVPAGLYTLTLEGIEEDESATGDLDITDDLTIIGAGPTATIIDGNQIDRVIHNRGQALTLSNLTIKNGTVGQSKHGGGINSSGTLTIMNSIISDNNGDEGSSGAGISSNTGTVFIDRSTISNNTLSKGEGGGIYFGQGINATITRSSIVNNSVTGNSTANRGGGIYNESKNTVTISDTTIDGNYSSTSGGGIYSYIILAGRMELNRVTLHANRAEAFGGGIYNAGEMYLTNVTVAENLADGVLNEFGGGIYNKDDTLIIVNSTIAQNQGRVGGGIYRQSGTVVLMNTILAYNLATEIIPPGDPNTHNCAGVVGSSGYNLEDGNDCNFVSPGDISGVDPLLVHYSLGSEWVYVFPLREESPAVDSANNAVCPDVDAAGRIRPVDGDSNGSLICDIGAYEFP